MSSTVTLAQIAQYAAVRRPSVSNWRRRHADFPLPVGGLPTQPLFDADEVAEWLDRRPVANPLTDARTSYGDVFRTGLRRGGPIGVATSTRAALDPDVFVHLALALVALKAARQDALPGEASALVNRCADAESTHVALAGVTTRVADHVADAVAMVTDVERLVDEFGVGGAADEVISAAGRRGWSGGLIETPIEICDLIARLTTEMWGDLADATIADLAAGAGRLLTSLGADGRLGDIRSAEADLSTATLLRLRLFCHGYGDVIIHADGMDIEPFLGSDIVLVDPPFQPGEQDDQDDHPLSWATIAVECLNPDGLGFAVVPEWTLTRSATSRRLPVVWARDQLVRNGLVRAIIQLPRRTHRYLAATDLVLLLLGATDADRQRDVIICDADQIRAQVGASWVEQTTLLVCGSRASRQGQPCVTLPATELVGRRSMLPSHLLTPQAEPEDRLLDTVRARQAALATFSDIGLDAVEVLKQLAVSQRPAGVSHRTVGELLRGRQLIRLPGHRVPDSDLTRNGQKVLGREELSGQVPIGDRRIDIVSLGRHHAAELTEPGDVIIMAGGPLRLYVDDNGGSVLLSPVQALRIPGYVIHSSLFRDEPQQAWIGPYALATLLGAARNAGRTGERVRSVTLQQLEIPVLTVAEYGHLDEVTRAIHQLAEHARSQAAALDLVRKRIAAGVADGVMTLRLKPETAYQNI